jgi:GTP-binding protein
LLNALTGQERTIVSEIAGTTRDTIHTHYNLFNKEFVLIDTAGIRRKAKVNEDLEFYSVIRAIKAVDEADVCLLLLDAEKGIAAQDLSIFAMAVKKGKGIVVLVNKWDVMPKETNTARDYEIELKKRFAPFSGLPIIFISAIEKTRIFKAMELTHVTDSKCVAKVGDTTSDLLEGSSAGCGWVIGVTTGAYTRSELQREKHTHLIENVREVLEIFSLNFG